MMTKEMQDCEFWLPADFLTDDFFADNSAVESPPAETESENEDEYIAGLTQKMAHAFLNEDEDKGSFAPARENPKPSLLATSPQSTLCGIGSWSFSSKGSPDGPSQVSSPPSTPFQQPRDDALDLLYAAAGQVVSMGLQDENPQARGLLTVPQDPAPQIQPPPRSQQRLGVFSNQDLIQQQLQAARFYQLKRQQLLKQQLSAAWGRQQQQSRERVAVRHLGLSNSAWPPLQKQQQQQQPGSGMTAVFLNGGRRQSNGTGVFLPRRVGTPNDSKKKPACSTVLLPARVVQALNLNLDEVGVHSRLPGCYVLENDAAMGRSNTAMSYSKRNQPAPMAAASPEIRLPQEWTY